MGSRGPLLSVASRACWEGRGGAFIEHLLDAPSEGLWSYSPGAHSGPHGECPQLPLPLTAQPGPQSHGPSAPSLPLHRPSPPRLWERGSTAATHRRGQGFLSCSNPRPLWPGPAPPQPSPRGITALLGFLPMGLGGKDRSLLVPVPAGTASPGRGALQLCPHQGHNRDSRATLSCPWADVRLRFTAWPFCPLVRTPAHLRTMASPPAVLQPKACLRQARVFLTFIIQNQSGRGGGRAAGLSGTPHLQPGQ